MDGVRYKGGWIRQRPSEKDRGVDHPTNVGLLNAVNSARAALPTSVDLRKYDVPIVDQGALGSCPANAMAGLLGWVIKKYNGVTFISSRLFTYYYARMLDGSATDQDTGSTVRAAMASIAMFGVPPEESSLYGVSWPYDISKYTQSPPMKASVAALNYQGISYALIDKPGTSDVLEAVKSVLATGIPMAFGFDCFESIFDKEAIETGAIPVPTRNERIIAGHVVEAVGYDDDYISINPRDKSESTGALLIKNSWGTKWGEGGYGHLPYWYLQNGNLRHAADFWTLTAAKFLNMNHFFV